MKKIMKAEQIAQMLKAGESVTFIKRMLGVSESYIYTIKKQMEGAMETVKETILSVNTDVYPEAKRIVGTAERKVAGGPATMVRATTEDRVEKILDERAATYGSFMDVAKVAQQLKHVAASHTIAIGAELSHDKIEALEMIFSKIARILNGNPNHTDSWIDIAGYATLVADRIKGKIR
jgi:hypothetical protein